MAAVFGRIVSTICQWTLVKQTLLCKRGFSEQTITRFFLKFPPLYLSSSIMGTTTTNNGSNITNTICPSFHYDASQYTSTAVSHYSFDSVLRKRRRKMNRHKYKKLRKKQKFLRRRLKK